MDLEDVVQHRHQLPLAIDPLLPSQGEAFDSDCLADIAEDRFDDAEALTIDVSAEVGVDLLSHPLERAIFSLAFGQGFEQDIDLPGAFLTGAAQAFATLLAAIAVGLASHELHENVIAYFGSCALEPHRLARRADAGLLLGVDGEGLYRVAPFA